MKVTIPTLLEAKKNGKKFSVVSCYDYTSAVLSASAGVDVLLAGDSASQFMLGFNSTTDVPMEYMFVITSGLRRASSDLLLVADMPYNGCCKGKDGTVKNSQRFITECGADIVKIEMVEANLDTIKAMVDAGIPVMPHIGIRPQTGKYKAEGTTAEVGAELIRFAEELYNIGAKMLLIEGTAREVAKIISEKLPIPVISCGSGPDCDGQVLVLPDILGLREGPIPKFAKRFGNVGSAMIDAISSYSNQIKQGIFPDDEHSYHMKSGEYEKLKTMIK
jgi:3-methyl-2-oxobutanoate hydroxymethyltransferase